jgi:hypothetical protein
MAQTKQTKQLVALVALLAVAGLVWHFYFDKGVTGTGTASASGAYKPINAEDYSVILNEWTDAQSTEYKPSGRNIFIAGPAPVAPSESVAAKPVKEPFQPQGPTLPPPPPLPVLSWKFFGYGTLPSNGARRAFLLDKEKEEVHIVTEGETVENHIRITHIGNDRIEYEDTVTGQKNTTNLEAAPSA